MTDRYTITELVMAKGTSAPVKVALLEMEKKIIALEAENERLRERLRSIVKGVENGQALFIERQGNRSKPIWFAVNVLQDYLAAAKGTARAALGEQQ